MSEDVELAAKTTGEVVAAITEKSGILAVPQEYASYVATRIHLRHYPKLIERTMATAEKIRESGLPQRAFEAIDEPLLTAILEGMAEETEPDLQDAWENLLANALTKSSAHVPRAFPRILKELEPSEAVFLTRFSKDPYLDIRPSGFFRSPLEEAGTVGVENLIRLRILDDIRTVRRADPDDLMGTPTDTFETTLHVEGARLTDLGRDFLVACQPPKAAQVFGSSAES